MLVRQAERNVSHEDNNNWLRVVQDEMNFFFSFFLNETYKWEQLPKGRKTLKNKWVFKLKRDNSRKLMKYKTWLVIKGFR